MHTLLLVRNVITLPFLSTVCNFPQSMLMLTTSHSIGGGMGA